MRRIGFRARYIQPILDGMKTSTLRAAHLALPKVGEVVALRCRYEDPPFAIARVVAVERITLSRLAREHADAEGYTTLAELRRDVRKLYGTRPLRLVRFELIEHEPTSV